MSIIFIDVAFRIQTNEGDYIMFETAQLIPESIDIPDEVSIVYKGKLHHVLETFANSPNLPDKLNEDTTLFPEEVQKAFQAFLKKNDEQIIYQNKKLMIPRDLKRLLIYDPNLISKIIPKARFSKTFNKDLKYEEHRVKFRRYHFALLDSMDIRIPLEFGKICGEKPLRYLKLSYLLTIAFQDILKSNELSEEIQNSQDKDFDSLMQPSEKSQDEKHKNDEKHENENDDDDDDDEKWIDVTPKPDFNFEDVGTEMAERVGEFMHEISQFDSIEADGPINFDFDTFKNKLDHFLDSSDDENNEEEEEEEADDQLFEHLEDDEEKILRCVADGKAPPEEYVKDHLDQSFNSQPSELGPTSNFMHLFNFK
ncbi:hypothetical protein TRFO_21598 [Tritrichomonas foetus]|uniref:Uncharacterized protein n=1 Tax=Tritrichomonas foetus TaxID=1144522 RepID=A0A1J4KIL3_9EUKA|nr:hypothetical protein TRFO_21598 [Tritrichomonas foetus]|eukprot:OHT09542.1 hypothetical protein TRFO_21598 [Tritrichomonas foetus]